MGLNIFNKKPQKPVEPTEEEIFNAKYKAKQEMKKVKKMIEENEKAQQMLMAKAASAKSKGYADVYKQCLQMLRVVKSRKVQAEKFLFQMETMMEMQSITQGSAELLKSMNEIMGTLGKFCLDPAAIQEAQAAFNKAQFQQAQQDEAIDRFLGGLESIIPDDEESGMSFSDADLENEINVFMNGPEFLSANGGEEVSVSQDDTARYNSMMNS